MIKGGCFRTARVLVEKGNVVIVKVGHAISIISITITRVGRVETVIIRIDRRFDRFNMGVELL